MKHQRLFRSAFALVLLLGSVHPLQALPVDLSVPPHAFGPTTDSGFASHWIELAELDFGGGMALPVRLGFQSGRTGDSTLFGQMPWRAPLLNSRIYDKSPSSWKVLLPCGRIMTLRPRADDPNRWATADGEWFVTPKDRHTLVSREDGWEMEFNHQNYLIRLRNDSGRQVVWNRDPGGTLLTIGEQPADKAQPAIPGLTVNRDPGTKLITSFTYRTTYGQKTHSLAYDAERRLTRVSFPDGTDSQISYSTSAAGHPAMDVVGRNLIRSTLVWHKENRTLLSDGVWSYSFTAQDGNNPIIQRTGPNGEVEIHHDDRINVRESFTAADGTQTIRHKVKTGPAKGKLERVTRILASKEEPRTQNQEQTLYTAVYDARGILTEETDALGRRTSHTYILHGATIHAGVKIHTKTLTAPNYSVKSSEEFDNRGNLIVSTDRLGHSVNHEYDRQNRRIRTTGPDGTVGAKITYNAEGKIESRTDAAGNKTQFGYDKNGNLVTTTDALGNVTTDGFDARGNKISSTDALGRVWKFEHDKGGRLIRKIGPDGVEIERRAYDDRGRIIATTDAAGNTSQTTYDLFGRVTSRTDVLGRVTTFSYDVKRGASGCTACNASAMPTLITMPSGRTVERVYGADRRLIEEKTGAFSPSAGKGTAAKPTSPGLASTRYAYDLAGNLTSITDPLGRVTAFEYDAGNNRIKTTHPDGTTRTASFNATGQMIAETDETGAVTQREYDAYGNLVSIIDAVGGKMRILFDGPGTAAMRRSSGTLSAAGVRTDVLHDALGHRIAEVVGASSREAAVAAVSAGVLDPNSAIAVTRHEFDAVGNEIRAISPSGKITNHQYDLRNRRVVTAEPLGRVWKFVHADNAGPSGPAPCCGADPGANSKAWETVLPDGTKESRVLDAAGQLVKTVDPKGDSIAYNYDPDGRLETLTDAKGNVTRWTYDALGKLASKTYPDKSMELYENDLAGQLVRRIRPDGTGATYTYNQCRKLTRIQWDQNKAEPSTFTYDLAGRMTQAKNLSATVERQYDAKGQLKNETQTITTPENTNPFSVAYAHDADGKLHSLTYPDGTIITYLYNARGELDEVTDSSSTLSAPGSPSPRPLALYERLADGNIAKLTLANGLTTTRSYDEAGRLTEIQHTSTTGEVLESEASRYDARDRRTARIRGDGTADLFSYDPAGQVIAAAYGQASTVAITAPRDEPKSPDSPNSAITEKEGFTPTQTFAYDAAGNRMKTIDQGQSTEYTANENNQYTTIAENGQQHEPDYDKSGNLLHDATRKFTWDADIHLLSVTTTPSEAQAPGSLSPSTIANKSKQSSTASFRYDPLHRRVSRTESSTQTTTYFVHDGWNVIAEYSAPLPNNRSTTAQQSLNKAQPALAARHIWGEDLSRTLQRAGGIGGLLSSTHNISSTQNEEQGTKNLSLFFSYDSNGNVILLTDAQSLTAAKYKYDAFGRTIETTGTAANLNRYQFSTKPVELASGLAFYGYRYYDPNSGRWPSRDPIGERGGVNVYVMVGNRPVEGWDYLGLVESNDETPCDNDHVGTTREVCEAKITDGLAPNIEDSADEVFKKVGSRFGVPGQISVAAFNAITAALASTATPGATKGFYFRKKTEVCTKNGFSICSWYTWEKSGTPSAWGFHDDFQLSFALLQGQAWLDQFKQVWQNRIGSCQ